MHFILYLTLENIQMSVYGPETELPYESNPKIEYYPLKNGWDDVDLFDDDLDDIDNYCNALLDYGDVEYFNSTKCAKLKEWIESRLSRPTNQRYEELLNILLDYSSRAVELNTGVTIDL